MRIKEPFTIYLRTIKNNGKQRYIYYYKARQVDGQQAYGKSTGIEVLNPENEKELKSKKNKARAVCNELLDSGKILSFSGDTFESFTKDFFTEKCDYVQWKKAQGTEEKKGIREKTIAHYSQTLRIIILPFFAKKRIPEITRFDIKNFMLKMKNTYMNSSINNAVSVLSIIFKQAVEKGIISYSPVQNIGRLQSKKKQIDLLTINELKLLFSLKWQNETYKKCVILLCITGMRVGEAVALKKEDINGDYIDVNKSWSYEFGLGGTKTGEKRKVPFCQLASDFFLFESCDNFLFRQKRKELPVNQPSILVALKTMLETIHIDYSIRGLTVHSLRHFFNTYLLSENISEAKIRAVLGHSDSTMTGVYTNWNVSMFSEVYEAQEKLLRSIIA